MRLTLLVLAIFIPTTAWGSQAVSFLRSHNFQLSSASSLRSWLGVPELGKQTPFEFRTVFAENREVPAIYDDVKSKDPGRIQNRLNDSFGKPYDAEAKVGGTFRLNRIEQGIYANGGAAMMVSDPVFPELSGILFNDFTLFTGTELSLPAGIKLDPSLQYGWRRVMERSFTVGQLIDSQPSLKLKDNPYHFYSELNLKAERAFSFVVAGASLTSFPLIHHDYDYWKTELSLRSHDLFRSLNLKFPRQIYFWAAFQPLFGGQYTWQRTIRVGTSVAWLSFLRTDIFLFDGFRPAGIITARLAFADIELFTMERSEDEHKTFNSRQYGLSLAMHF